MSTPSTPEYPPVIPYLTVTNGSKVIEFYKAAFGARELYRLKSPNDGVGHAELEIQGQVFMLADEFPGMSTSPATLGGSACTMVLMVPDTDAAHERAVAAGAESIRAPMDAFYGFRMAVVKDPAGHQWMLQHEIEIVAPEEMQKRWDAMAGACPSSADKASS
jgi:PhnB protein